MGAKSNAGFDPSLVWSQRNTTPKRRESFFQFGALILFPGTRHHRRFQSPQTFGRLKNTTPETETKAITIPAKMKTQLGTWVVSPCA